MFRSVRALPHIEIERESDPARVSLFTVNSSEHCCSGERCSCRVRDLGHPAMSAQCPVCPKAPLDRDRHDGLDAKQKFQRAGGGLQLLGVTIAVRAREHRSRRRVISSRCWPAPPAISPLLVLFAVFFWSFLWEIPGAFIWRTGHYCDANNVRPVRRQLLARGATLRFGKPEIGPVAPFYFT